MYILDLSDLHTAMSTIVFLCLSMVQTGVITDHIASKLATGRLIGPVS